MNIIIAFAELYLCIAILYLFLIGIRNPFHPWWPMAKKALMWPKYLRRWFINDIGGGL